MIFQEDDGQTRFTAYSMTSSIMRRNQNLQNLDENFEGYFAQFDDEELGDMPQKDLDQNEIDHDSKLLENAIQADYKEFKGEVRYGEGVGYITKDEFKEQRLFRFTT